MVVEVEVVVGVVEVAIGVVVVVVELLLIVLVVGAIVGSDGSETIGEICCCC